jgi:outer membrane protein assembly factor BamB
VIDLQRSRVVRHVLVGRRPVAVAIGHGSVWVANADDGTVSGIDQDRHELIRTIGIEAPAIDLAVTADAVWVANGSDGTVSRIDPSADAVVETINLRGSSELVWNPTYAVDADDDSVWLAAGTHHVLHIDPATNEPSAIIDVGHVPVGVALGEGALWVVTIAERALRIEPHTNTATTEVPIGYPVALAAGTQAVWVSDSLGQVWRINPDTGTVTQTTPVGRGLVGLCAMDGAVFAANTLHGARQDVTAEVGLVDIDSDPPDSMLSCRLQRPESAGAGDLEHDSRALRDLAQGDRPAFHRVEEAVGIAVQRRDVRIGSSRACLVAGDVPLDSRHPLAADRADHLLPGRERQHERSQVTGQIAGLLFPEHEAHDVRRAMRQIVVGGIDDREPRFWKPGGDAVDRCGGIEAHSDDEVVLLSCEK